MIRVAQLGKRYRIGAQQARYTTLRDSLVGAVTGPLRRFRNSKSLTQPSDTFWALKEVSFEVKAGEVVGVIGRNGAGKSTLLKILAHITEPTEGRVRLRGRVGSLLEVGTGFHAELTGRENVYLNGAILGMRRAEIERKFDEIVAFAEIEKFLDTPVKHYSSGMYVRLAFAVAAHLEPEILVVDEVLAVGDAEFQRKCLGKMKDVAHEGRTVLFVSHNMEAVNRLCERGILLDKGQVQASGDILRITGLYLKASINTMKEQTWDIQKAPGDDVARLKAVRIIADGQVTGTVDSKQAVTIEMEYVNLKANSNLAACITLINEQGVHLIRAVDMDEPEWGDKPRPVGIFRSRCTIPGNLLAAGWIGVVAEVYTLYPSNYSHFLVRDSAGFQVVYSDGEGLGRSIPGLGVIRPILAWENQYKYEQITS